MLRKSMVIGASALLLAGLAPAVSTASASPLSSLASTTQPKDDDRYVNLDAANQDRNAPGYDVKDFKSVEPTEVVEASDNGGQRVEIYGSIGDNEGGMDWRTVNEFSYLVNSVPKNKHSYTTLFNSLFDNRSISYSSGKWKAATSNEVFAPTAAYLNQTNLYPNQTERMKYIHVLGAKESMGEAWDANSSLARLVQADYKGKGSITQQAVDYFECPGDGGCLSGPSHLMHSKYGAFEQAADSNGTIHNNVVWMTSSNLNGSSGSKKANLSIVIFDDEEAYDQIVDGIFKPSRRVANGEKYYNVIDDTPLYESAISKSSVDGAVPGVLTVRGMPTDSGITLLPSPRRRTKAADYTEYTDVEAAFLKKQADTSTTKPGCKIYAVHSLFNNTRDGVFNALSKLKQQDCDVRIVLGENALSDLVDGYFNMSEDLREVIGRVEFGNVHDKTLSYKSGATATTFGGASNFTGPGLEYDELAFKADNAAVTDAVQEHSERIYQLAKGQVSWAAPTSVSTLPSGTPHVKVGSTLRVSPRVKPSNALVTKTTWVQTGGVGKATVTQDGDNALIKGVAVGPATFKVTVQAPGTLQVAGVSKSKTITVNVTTGNSSTSANNLASLPPTLTMDNYQTPGGLTDITVTWGSGKHDYNGIVKLQYYAGGWKTYTKSIRTNDSGVGRMSVNFGSSKTWQAYGARLDKIDGVNVPNSTLKTKSKWSYNTVRTRSASSTPRLYATTMAKVGKVPMLLQRNGGGKLRLQMRGSSGPWKTHKTYYVHGDQEFIVMPILNTKYWRIASSSGVSNTVRISMR